MHDDGKATSGRATIRRPSRLGDEVYEAIYAQLMSLDIPPGAKLSIGRLARDLGVSQTPVREALSRLEAKGLVVSTHLVGYSAASQIDSESLGQLYEMRLLLEPYAAREAAHRMSDELLAQLRDLDAQMQAARTDARGSYSQFASLDGQFHDLVAQGGGNDLVRDAMARLHAHAHLFRLFYLASATSEANEEHARIVDAIVRRNPEAAETAMHDHICKSRERFMGDTAS